MSTDDICALPIKDIIAKDSVLFLWATWPKLPDALQVIASWGFDYLSGVPWLKVERGLAQSHAGQLYFQPQFGVGFWFRGATEALLVARRGNVQAWDDPPLGLAPGSSLGLVSENWGHSRKPDNVYELAERLPGPYLELFARRGRPGWDVYGNEAPDSIAFDGVEMNPVLVVDDQLKLWR